MLITLHGDFSSYFCLLNSTNKHTLVCCSLFKKQACFMVLMFLLLVIFIKKHLIYKIGIMNLNLLL